MVSALPPSLPTASAIYSLCPEIESYERNIKDSHPVKRTVLDILGK